MLCTVVSKTTTTTTTKITAITSSNTTTNTYTTTTTTTNIAQCNFLGPLLKFTLYRTVRAFCWAATLSHLLDSFVAVSEVSGAY